MHIYVIPTLKALVNTLRYFRCLTLKVRRTQVGAAFGGKRLG